MFSKTAREGVTVYCTYVANVKNESFLCYFLQLLYSENILAFSKISPA